MYQQKIAPALKLLKEAIKRINESNSDIAHSYVDDLTIVQEVLENPFQTIPPERYIHITTSFCDPEGSSDKAHDDRINFHREITPAMLYSKLDEHVKSYNPNYYLQVNLHEIEEWINTQHTLLKTANRFDYDSPIIEDEGLTIADFKTNYGSIDFFIEFGINFGDHQ